ncbi:uncharacterized protein BJ171DRAFT_493258 [Polychytrium aggregatum]|uniref:uncharacterized protein n=1 Tax=Polychytrium aggregatum TaxID=110093 RepID=UPI0022FDCF1A|nr:uncharacterized protein BJ171DRAFT_493258 [Polychytrium aggregatum]KAI9207624.1 hypothetical protein BJ171DRAFT_493258 [Polychytrium aggregatum]
MHSKLAFFLALALALAQVALSQIVYPVGTSKVLVYADKGSDGRPNLRLQVPSSLSWFGIGTGAQMSGSDMLIVWRNSDGSVTASHRTSTGHNTPVETNPSAITVLTNQASSSPTPTGSFVVTVAVPTTWASSSSFIMAALVGAPPASKSTSASFQQHSSQTAVFLQLLSSSNSFTLNGNNPNSTGTVVTGAGSSGTWIIVHALIMGAAWVVVVPIGVFIAQFLKSSLGSSWFTLHQVLMGGVTGLGSLVGFGIIFYSVQENGESHFSIASQGAHGIFGLVILGLMLVQIGFGVYIDKTFDVNRTRVPVRDKLHWHLGRLLFVAALVNVVLGCLLIQVSIVIWALIAVWVVAVILVFGYHMFKNRGKDYRHHDKVHSHEYSLEPVAPYQY